MRRATKLVAFTACGLATASCALIWGIDEPQPEPGDDGGLGDARVCTSTLDAGVGDGSPPSCAGDAAGLWSCGPSHDESCCATELVTGGSGFLRGYVKPSSTDPSNPASVSSFMLDKYEVTVGRFRQFVAAAPPYPQPGDGKHVHLANGCGLNGGTEPGWQAEWNDFVPNGEAAWNNALMATTCTNGTFTWTPDAGANENLPITCLTWYELYAFCIWDQGFLPTDAEWNFAASGGVKQRLYPWASTTIDCTYANVSLDSGTDGANEPCNRGMVPVDWLEAGVGLFGQWNLAGNAEEWVLDVWDDGGYVNPCFDCALLVENESGSRTYRGGSVSPSRPYTQAQNTYHSYNLASQPQADYGGRCARPAPP